MILTTHLLDEFLKAMDDIGRYGEEKHGEKSFQAARIKHDTERPSERCSSKSIAWHAADHYEAYLRGKKHDHFGSFRHQLAAVAFNAMMEFYFAGLENERNEENLRKLTVA